MNVTPLIRIAIESAVFFGMSSDDVIQPDAAVAQLETIASILQQLDESERQEFLRFVEGVAKEEEAQAGNTQRVEFLRSLGENLGLI